MATTETSSDNRNYEGFGPCVYEDYGSNFLPVLYSLFFVLGFLGNVFVLWVKIFGEGIRTMTDVCLLNLALADLLLVCTLPFLAHQATGPDQWPFGDAMCKVVLGAYLIGFYCGIFFIIVISVDWYLAIVHVFSAPKTRTGSVGITVAAVIWFAGIVASFPELTLFEVQVRSQNSNKTFCAPLYDENRNTTYETNHFWGIFGLFKMNILGLLIPMAIMGFCYTRIICVLRVNRTPMKRSAIRLALVVVAAFFCCWTPYNVASFFKALELLGTKYTKCKSSKHIKLTLQVTEAIAYSHSSLNPLLYFCVGGRFKKNLLKLMDSAPCRLCQFMSTLIPLDRVKEPDNPQQTPCVGDNCEDSIALNQIECINSMN